MISPSLFKRVVLASSVVLASIASSAAPTSAASSSDIYDLPTSELVMNRSYTVKNEVGVLAGYLPIGAINKYISFGFNYIHFMSDYQGWEVVHFQSTQELVGALKKDLQGPPWNAQDSELPSLKYIATSNYVFAPFYTKATLFNSKVIHTQLLLSLGGGVAQFVQKASFLVDVGITERFFLTPTSSVKFDFRYYPVLSDMPLAKSQMALLGVYSWSFGAQ